MIDLRCLPTEAGLSNHLPTDGTRFIWMRVCEHCLSRTIRVVEGVQRCDGCLRFAMVSTLEEADHP